VLVLSPGETRSGSSENEALLTANKQTLQLRLKVINDIFKSFRATIRRKDSSAPAFTLSQVAVRKGASETFVILQASAGRFTNGEYKIELSGITTDGKTDPVVDRYTFRVRKNF
jgi:hypothetical protein